MKRINIVQTSDGRSAMRDVVSGWDVSGTEARPMAAPASARVHTFAVYSAFGLIAAVVFGTLSYHPF